MPGSDYNNIEPMQIDIPGEENENANNVEEEAFVVENSSLDLESYINAFSGMARLFRLIHISDHCPSLRIEALKMAIAHVQTTYNTTMYQQLHKKLAEATLGTGGVVPDVAGVGIPLLDSTWVEERKKRGELKLEKLDVDLKNYKSNSIKESIRRGHDDLAEHYIDSGDLNNALRCFSRARDYCTSPKHVINMCLNVIKVSVYLQNWSHVLNFVAKAESTPDVAESGKSSGKDSPLVTSSRLKCSAGLAELGCRKYRGAAKQFLGASFDHCDFPELLSPNNVAIYGGLCALATYDREELQKSLISSTSFKLFLELEPQVRDIIFKFYESKYGTCLRLLDEIKDNLLLDLYLAPHVNSLYAQIRSRALIQYLTPYDSAHLSTMASAFNTSLSSLENELLKLILSGQISGRIDSQNKVIFAKRVEERGSTFESSLKMGEEIERRTKLMILRTALLSANIQVKSNGTLDAPGNSNAARL